MVRCAVPAAVMALVLALRHLRLGETLLETP
jgi:hypothetical protein